MCIKINVGGGLLCNCHCYDYARDEFLRLEFAIETEQQTTEMETHSQANNKFITCYRSSELTLFSL